MEREIGLISLSPHRTRKFFGGFSVKPKPIPRALQGLVLTALSDFTSCPLPPAVCALSSPGRARQMPPCPGHQTLAPLSPDSWFLLGLHVLSGRPQRPHSKLSELGHGIILWHYVTVTAYDDLSTQLPAPPVGCKLHVGRDHVCFVLCCIPYKLMQYVANSNVWMDGWMHGHTDEWMKHLLFGKYCTRNFIHIGIKLLPVPSKILSSHRRKETSE